VPPRRTRVHHALFFLFAAILIAQAFVPPPIGMANNGDFSKVAAMFSLTAPTEDEFSYLIRTWHFDRAARKDLEFVSSEQGLAWIAVRLDRIFRHDGRFDIRMMGAVHAALYLLAFYLLLPLLPRRAAIVTALLLIVIFAGAMCVEWMNTFYMDAATLVFLMLAAVFYLRAVAWGRRGDQIAFVACAILMAGSKAQHAVLAVPLAALILCEPRWRKRIFFTRRAAALVILAAGVAWWFTPAEYRVGPTYNMIFTDILPRSQTVDRDLQELGLDSSYRPLIGTFNYEPRSPMRNPEYAKEFGARTSHTRILQFFLHHPGRGVLTVIHGLNSAARQRAAIGDYERATGREPYTQARAFSPWSSLKETFFNGNGTMYLIYIVAVCAIALAAIWKTPYRAGAICLVAMIALAGLVTTLGDALEPIRHAFLLNALIDMMLAAGAAALLSRYWAEASEKEISS